VVTTAKGLVVKVISNLANDLCLCPDLFFCKES